jgi:hypothetical protein
VVALPQVMAVRSADAHRPMHWVRSHDDAREHWIPG